MSKPSWYRQGKDEKPQESTRRDYHPRFWLKKGESAYVTICDEEPLIFMEHNFKIGKSFNNYTTCMKNIGEPCELCDLDHYAADKSFLTIVDHREIEDSKKKVHVNVKRLLPMGSKAYAQFELCKQKIEAEGGTLQGAMIQITRTTDDKSPNCGNNFSFEGYIDLEDDWVDFDLEPLDYDLLAPDAEHVKEMARKVGRYSQEDNKKSSGGKPPVKPNASKPKFN